MKRAAAAALTAEQACWECLVLPPVHVWYVDVKGGAGSEILLIFMHLSAFINYFLKLFSVMFSELVLSLSSYAENT